MKFDPDSLARRIPLDWYLRYQNGVRGGADGSLDDSRKLVRLGLWILLGFFGLLLVWGALAPLSGAAIAPGVVTVAGNRQTLQTLNGGVVEEVMVREGQRVDAGQVLMRMNGLSAGAEGRQTQAQQDALRAAQARLVAERDRTEAIAFPTDLAGRAGQAQVAETLSSQVSLFANRKAIFDADRRIEQARLAAARAEADTPARQLNYVREQVAGMRSLYRRGYAPKSVLYDLESQRVALEGKVAVGRAQAMEAELTATRAESARQGQILEELRVVQTQLGQVNPQAEVARYRADRDVVRSAVAGAVVDLARFAPGSVLTPGQKLMDILPDGRSLIVEARVRPDDIDDVRVGSKADVRFTTVNPRGMSKIHGTVTTLSADRLTDPATGVGYYLALISLDAEQIEESGMQLTAGLPASVNIRTKDRSFLNFILSPLTDAFSKVGRAE